VIGPGEPGVDPDWLALREPADVRARDATAEAVLPPLLEHLNEREHHRPGGPGEPGGPGLRVVDLGAGTGANLRWLAPRLATGGPTATAGQRWTLIDHDPRLRAWGPVPHTTVHADVSDLPGLLAASVGVDLVTSAALLDLLDDRALTAIVEACGAGTVPALLALSVTGEVRLDPGDHLDGAVAEAFDAHQRRGGRLGPRAGHECARRFADRGWTVVEVATPWRLGPAEPDLLAAWLAGRAGAAVEQAPELADPLRAWSRRRTAQMRDGGLSAVVGHVDVVALPPRRRAGSG